MGNTTKSIDWNSCLELSNHKPDLAKELLTMFIDDMPNAKNDIEKALHENNLEMLGNYAHKLHGACCYVGVPKLRAIIRELENAARQHKKANCTLLIQKMRLEMEAVKISAEKKDYL